MFDDSQTQTSAPGRTRTCRVRPVEAFEDAAEVRTRDADALVADRDLDVVASTAYADRNSGARSAVGDGVFQQVAERSDELRVTAEGLYVSLAAVVEPDVFGVRRGPDMVDGVVDDCVDGDGCASWQGLAALQPGQLDQLLDQS